MINALLGKKIAQTQRFLEDGTRIPVTILDASGNTVVDIKTQEKNGYSAVQLGFGTKRKEVSLNADEKLPEKGQAIQISEVFTPGNVVAISGISKGKGFAGVVKRHHFKGGPRTHGQSDRERAPGSIGQTTTPGRVYKGKRMAGRMGHKQATITNVRIVGIDGEKIIVSGLLPGGRNSILVIEKTGEGKKFVPLYVRPGAIDQEPVIKEGNGDTTQKTSESSRVAKEGEENAG